MSTSEIFLIAVVVIYAVPWLVWRLARTDRFAPLVVVQIMGGIVLGPGVLGAVWPAYYAFVFAPPVIAALNGIAWWAVMLFVFVAGLELDVAGAWRDRRETGLTAALALAVPLLLGTAAGALILAWPGWLGPRGTPLQAMLGIGMACAVTALPIMVLLLERLEILRTALGQRLLRYASLDDVAIWGVLALILLDWERIWGQAGFLLLFPLAAWLVRRVIQQVNDDDRWQIALVWLAAAAFAADWAGLHFMVGAFLAGVVLDPAWLGQDRVDAFRRFVLLALMPVFFLSTGLKTQWGVGGMAVLGVAALLLAVSVAGKLIGVGIAGRVLGWPRGEATVIGWLLQTKALIMILFVSVLLDRQIITAETFTALLLMAVASTALTVPMVSGRLAALRPRG